MTYSEPLDLTIRRGITFGPVLIHCRNAANLPVNLTGWQAFAHARISSASPLAFDLFPTISDPINGVVSIGEFSIYQTMEFRNGNYIWDLVLMNTADKRIGPLIGGTVVVETPSTLPPTA